MAEPTAFDTDALDAAAARPPRERGRTEIADVAAQRIAELAAREVDGVRIATAPMGQLLGKLPGVTGTLPRATITTAGTRARVELSIGVHWPHPLAGVAEQVRERVSERLATLTGMTIDRVEVSVVDVALPEIPKRVVR